MADGTVLNPGTGGDTILTEDLGTSKIPVSKIYTGTTDKSTGPVTDDNPFSVDAASAGDLMHILQALLLEQRLTNALLFRLCDSAGIKAGITRQDLEMTLIERTN